MLCPNCFNENGPSDSCSQCGYDAKLDQRSLMYLPVRTVLDGKYIVGRGLGSPGGFSITYLAFHIHLQKKVAIKEFFPREYVYRDGLTAVIHDENCKIRFQEGLQKFIIEAQTLARLNHNNIVKVLDVFEENNSAYLVMDFYEGQTLTEFMQERQQPLSEQELLAIFLPLLDGLSTIHDQGLLHRDIKPDNIYLTQDNRAILLDFGAAREVMSGEQSRSIVFTPGFAPYEQYNSKAVQGPWTDIYACAMTMYYLLTLKTLPDIIERMGGTTLEPLQQAAPQIGASVAKAIMQGLSIQAADRPQSVAAFLQLLKGEADNKTIKIIHPFPITQKLAEPVPIILPSIPLFKRRLGKIAAVLVAALLLIIGGYYYYAYATNPVTKLASQGIAVTSQALFQSIRDGNAERVGLLLQVGIDPNVVSPEGTPALLEAIKFDNIEIAKMLAAKGAVFTATDQAGHTAFAWALKQNVSMMEYVFEMQKVDPAGGESISWLEQAFNLDNLAAIRLLIQKGADPNITDKMGATLLDKAVLKGKTELTELLKGLGGKRNVVWADFDRVREKARFSFNMVSTDGASYQVFLFADDEQIEPVHLFSGLGTYGDRLVKGTYQAAVMQDKIGTVQSLPLSGSQDQKATFNLNRKMAHVLPGAPTLLIVEQSGASSGNLASFFYLKNMLLTPVTFEYPNGKKSDSIVTSGVKSENGKVVIRSGTGISSLFGYNYSYWVFDEQRGVLRLESQ